MTGNKTMDKTTLVGKFVSFMDRQGKHRLWKVTKVGTKYISFRGHLGERARVPLQKVGRCYYYKKWREINWDK